MINDINLQKIIEDLFMVLSEKEKTVITRRFALNNGSRETLERIGKMFEVTRERVRQIESSALRKLQRNIGNTKLNIVFFYNECPGPFSAALQFLKAMICNKNGLESFYILCFS